jgi:hypothetical protein
VANEIYGELMKSQKGEAEVDLLRVNQTCGYTTFFHNKTLLLALDQTRVFRRK